MASRVSQSVDVSSAHFDVVTDGPLGATFWTGQDHSDVDWSDDANMMVIHLDPEGKVVHWNERARELTNFAAKEIVGYNFARDLVSRPLSRLVQKALRKTWAGEDVGCFQLPFFTKSGTKLRVLVNARCPSCGSTDYLLLKALTMDEVARQRAANNNAVMVVHVDSDGLVTEWDAGAQQISEFTCADMIGKDFVNTVIPAQQREPLEDAFMHALMCQEQDLTSAIPFQTKAGTKKWLSFRITPQYRLRGEQITGRLVGVVFIASVTTEPVTQEEEWIATCDSLPRLVPEPDVFMLCSAEEGDKKRLIGVHSTCASLEGFGDVIV